MAESTPSLHEAPQLVVRMPFERRGAITVENVTSRADVARLCLWLRRSDGWLALPRVIDELLAELEQEATR